MYDFTVSMGLLDFVPVIFFAVTAVLLLKNLYNKMTKSAYVALAAGLVNVFMAGFFKALWKLLYAGKLCDFQVLEAMFLPVNSIGLLLIGISICTMLLKKRRGAVLSVAPAVFSGNLLFIMMMILGMGGLCAGLSALAIRLKKRALAVLFIAAFALSMCMGYMSSRDSALSWVNWVEQGINSVSQLCLMAGVISLHKAGLGAMTLRPSGSGAHT